MRTVSSLVDMDGEWTAGKEGVLSKLQSRTFIKPPVFNLIFSLKLRNLFANAS